MASTQRTIVLASTALTVATTNGASLSVSPRSKKCIGYLVVSSPNGATTVAAKIQHSPDGVNGWTDFLTFTTTGAGVVANEVKLPVSDVLLPHIRAVVVLGGVTKIATVSVDLFVENYGG